MRLVGGPGVPPLGALFSRDIFGARVLSPPGGRSPPFLGPFLSPTTRGGPPNKGGFPRGSPHPFNKSFSPPKSLGGARPSLGFFFSQGGPEGDPKTPPLGVCETPLVWAPPPPSGPLFYSFPPRPPLFFPGGKFSRPPFGGCPPPGGFPPRFLVWGKPPPNAPWAFPPWGLLPGPLWEPFISLPLGEILSPGPNFFPPLPPALFGSPWLPPPTPFFFPPGRPPRG